MPVLIAFLTNALRVMLYVSIGKFIVGALAFLGLNFVVNKFAIEPIMGQIEAMMNQGPGGSFGAAALQWMGVLRLDDAVSMMLSAYVIVFSIKEARMFLGRVVA